MSQAVHSEGSQTFKYVVITPVRDDAQFMEKTVHSMIQETIKPAECVIVDDGSAHETADIVAGYAAELSWIRLVEREDRGTRQRGQDVIEAFYAGYETLTCQDHDIIAKLDGDSSLEPTYFESLLDESLSSPKLGTSGGGVHEIRGGETWVVHATKDQARGPTKAHRRTCLEAIGGLAPFGVPPRRNGWPRCRSGSSQW